jgi:glutamate-1-semialdehyde 2,1-aminomutase
LLLEGVELFSGGGMVSVAHTEDHIDETISAFDRALGRIEVEGAFAG